MGTVSGGNRGGKGIYVDSSAVLSTDCEGSSSYTRVVFADEGDITDWRSVILISVMLAIEHVAVKSESSLCKECSSA